MAVTSGFFNGSDRPSNATEICSLFEGVITDGIFSTYGNLFAVTAAGGNFLSIDTGKAWFNKTWLKNDSVLIAEAAASDLLLDRIDLVVLEFDNSDAVRKNDIKIITGTPASEPVMPALSAGPLKFQYLVSSILRHAGSDEIAQIDITPYQGTEQTPLMTGLVQQADITVILQQFADAMTDLEQQYEDALLVLQQNGVPVHHGNHSTNSSDPINPSDIGAAEVENGVVKALQARCLVQTKTESFTLSASDAEKVTILEHATVPIVVTIPLDSTYDFPIGTAFNFIRLGDAATSFEITGGITWKMANDIVAISSNGSSAILIKTGANKWWGICG